MDHVHQDPRRYLQAQGMIQPAGGPVQVGKAVLFLGQELFEDRRRLFPSDSAGGFGRPARVLRQDTGADIMPTF
jgi:hypothetical protein